MINWIIYTVLAVGGIISCCGGVLMFCRSFAGWCFLLPGVVAHLFVIIYTGIVLYHDDTVLCKEEGSTATDEVLADLMKIDKLYIAQVVLFIVITFLANIGVKQDKVFLDKKEPDEESEDDDNKDSAV